MSERIAMNGNEKLARVVSGLESDAKHFVVNGESAEKILQREATEKFNTRVDEYVDKFDKHAEKLREYAEKFNEQIDGMEIKAIKDNLLIQPFNENPFQRIQKTDSGIILDMGGQKPIYKSNETGEYEEEESAICVATVLDAGPDCKWVKDGDVVYCTKVSIVPVPFFKQNLNLLNENRVLAVVGEGLTKRFNK
jgi:co-chaperonin GroES (HSP10)